MKCHRAEFLNIDLPSKKAEDKRPHLPDTLVDYLTDREIPFSNRDYIRQKIVRFLVEEKGYLKTDLRDNRTILLDIDGQEVTSPVDISISIDGKTLMVWKCSSGSLVSRERQIIASARLLEEYVVPIAAVTNGADVEVLDVLSEKVIGSGFEGVPSRRQLLDMPVRLAKKTARSGKIAYEQRILFTYDAICCPSSRAGNSGI